MEDQRLQRLRAALKAANAAGFPGRVLEDAAAWLDDREREFEEWYGERAGVHRSIIRRQLLGYGLRAREIAVLECAWLLPIGGGLPRVPRLDPEAVSRTFRATLDQIKALPKDEKRKLNRERQRAEEEAGLPKLGRPTTPERIARQPLSAVGGKTEAMQERNRKAVRALRQFLKRGEN